RLARARRAHSAERGHTDALDTRPIQRFGGARMEGAQRRRARRARGFFGGEFMKRNAQTLFAALALAAPLAWADPGVMANRILLGQAAVFSGPAALLGTQMRNGIKTYLDYVNANGGVHGRKLELISEDDKYEPAL